MPDLIKVFKFREGNVRDLDAFFNNYLWFSPLGALNDPYEGFAHFSSEGVTNDLRVKFLKKVYATESKERNPEKVVHDLYMEHLKNGENEFADYVDGQAIEYLRDFHEAQREEIAVYSLSVSRGDDEKLPSPLNNMQMWAHYAGGFKGFCIEFDYAKLLESLKEKNKGRIATSQIHYADDQRLPIVSVKQLMESYLSDEHTASSIEILKAFATKQNSWAYENEVRVLGDVHGKMFFDPSCIRAIYVASPMPEWSKTFLCAAASSKGSQIKVYVVELHPEFYKFGIREIFQTDDD
ncbi:MULTISPECIES: DUF2971 domain-containing protein [unclassified Marinobacter]|uniref:DUF2971 domain-containing protein n=1 Tax=unclassified Marinobacter TaxID=83889 RepID=UPI00192979C8|nr:MULTISPECIES: DUF2971 domain-containing protein [unclassified Marinobacter]MBL3825252.1 DUF2971 domain-containing protein [Marinobacter sp. MC3]MBL3893544.1 DUF2971 domain-containing protein [Marinobacter sp. MW3]